MNATLQPATDRLASPTLTSALTRGIRLRRALSGLALALIVAVLGYLLLRPTLLRWGATDAEVSAALPGDLAGLRWTRAIAIDATPAEVWPYLVQWGQGRGGWYSYDWLENLLGFDIHSASAILPEHQNPALGDPICLARGVCFLNITVMEPERVLVFQGIDPEGHAFWSFALSLTPIDADHARLVLRESFAPGALPDAALYSLEIADVVMEQKTLDTLKLLAEGGAPSPLTTAAEIGVWLFALACGSVAGLLCLRRADWRLPLALGLAAVGVLVVLTFLYPPLWLRALLDLALAAGLYALLRRSQPTNRSLT